MTWNDFFTVAVPTFSVIAIMLSMASFIIAMIVWSDLKDMKTMRKLEMQQYDAVKASLKDLWKALNNAEDTIDELTEMVVDVSNNDIKKRDAIVDETIGEVEDKFSNAFEALSKWMITLDKRVTDISEKKTNCEDDLK